MLACDSSLTGTEIGLQLLSDEVFYSTFNKATKLRSSNFEFNLEFDIFVDCITIQECVCLMLFVVS